MSKSRFVFAGPLVLAMSMGAFAGDDNSSAVAALKASLPSALGFEVEDLRAGSDGVSCITYSLNNDQNGKSRSRAVVQGDKVLRESTGNTRFAKAWNGKCAGKK